VTNQLRRMHWRPSGPGQQAAHLGGSGEPLPAAQVLVYPLTTSEQFGESMEDAADARPLNRPLLS
jgi:hypothetical protein